MNKDDSIDCKKIVTEIKVGNRFNDDKVRWRNFPLWLLEDLMKVGAKGEYKYGTYNFLKGLYINDTLDSLKRHLMKFESPYLPDIDDESGLNHLYHIAWNALVAAHMMRTRPELDDRYKLEEKDEKSNL